MDVKSKLFVDLLGEQPAGKSWAKWVDVVNPAERGGYAFEGPWLNGVIFTGPRLVLAVWDGGAALAVANATNTTHIEFRELDSGRNAEALKQRAVEWLRGTEKARAPSTPPLPPTPAPDTLPAASVAEIRAQVIAAVTLLFNGGAA